MSRRPAVWVVESGRRPAICHAVADAVPFLWFYLAYKESVPIVSGSVELRSSRGLQREPVVCHASHVLQLV
eukprot:11191826-Lingulodinium_polyedra.AAC.1